MLPCDRQSIGRVAKESRALACEPLGRMLVERMHHPQSAYGQLRRRMAAQFFSTVGLMLVMLGCQGKDHASMLSHQAWERWEPGQVLDARTSLPVPLNSWLETLATYDTI